MKFDRKTWQSTMALTACLCACTHSACKNTVVAGVPSPDGAMIAFVFNRSCGAGRSATQVSLIDFHDALRNDTGNVLSVGTEQPVKVSWRDPETLVVSGFQNPVFQQTKQMHSITVEFR